MRTRHVEQGLADRDDAAFTGTADHQAHARQAALDESAQDGRQSVAFVVACGLQTEDPPHARARHAAATGTAA